VSYTTYSSLTIDNTFEDAECLMIEHQTVFDRRPSLTTGTTHHAHIAWKPVVLSKTKNQSVPPGFDFGALHPHHRPNILFLTNKAHIGL
jgi:hypothetical protein